MLDLLNLFGFWPDTREPRDKGPSGQLYLRRSYVAGQRSPIIEVNHCLVWNGIFRRTRHVMVAIFSNVSLFIKLPGLEPH